MGPRTLTSRRELLRLTALGAAGALLAACSPAAPAAEPTKPAAASGAAPAAAPVATAKPAASGGAPVQLRFHARSGVEDEMLNKMLPAFEEKNNAKVTQETFTGTEYFQKLQTLVAGGTLGDAMHIFTGDSSFQLFFAGGVLIPVDDYMKKDALKLDDYYKYSVEGAKIDGKYGGLPFKGHPSRVGLFYNKTMFDKAGLKPPTPDSKMEDIVDLSVKLTKKGADGKIEQWGFSHMWHDLQMYMIICRNFGGDLYSPDGKKNLLTSAEALAGYTWYADMSTKYKVVLDPLQTNPIPRDLFISGKIGMIRLNIGDKAAMKAIKDFDWNMTLPPKGPTGKRGSLAETDLLTITKFSKSPDLAWGLIKHLSSKEGGIALASQTGGGRSSTPGARPDVWGSPEVLGLPYPDGVQKLSLQAMEEVEPYSQADNFRGQEVMRAMDPILDLLLLGKEQPTKAFMEKLSGEVQTILDKQRP
jgi:multiple sugar transport system substrate-binding protein